MLKSHIRIAVRFFRKNLAFTLLNFFGLLTSFVTALVLVAYVNFQLSYDDFHSAADKLFRVQLGTDDMAPKTHPALSKALAEKFPDCEVTRLKSTNGSIGLGDKAFQEEKIYWVDNAFLSMFDYKMIAGTLEALKGKQTAVITKKLAFRLFAGLDVIGKTLVFVDAGNREQVFEVTGLLEDLPGNSHLTFSALFSYETLPESAPDYQYGWSWRGVYTYIKTTSIPPRAVGSFYKEIVSKYRNTPQVSLKADDEMILVPIGKIHLYSGSLPDAESYGNIDIVYFLTGFVFLLFIVAVFNYINLTGVSAVFRFKEIGIKKVIGARSVQIIKQFFVESILLFGTAFGISVIVLVIIFPFLNLILPIQHPFDLFADYKVILLIVLTMVGGIVVSGLYTFFLLNKASPSGLLKNNTGYFKPKNSGAMLMVVQFSVTIMLLVSTYAISRQIDYMRSKDLGITIGRIVVLKPPRQTKFDESLRQQFNDQVKGLSAIESIAACSQIPGKKINSTWWGITCADKRFVADENAEYSLIKADEDFLKTFQIKLIEGRNFEAFDVDKVIVNRSCIKSLGFEKPVEAIHQVVLIGNAKLEIIGVIDDYHHLALKANILPLIITRDIPAVPYYAVKLNAKDLVLAINDIRKVWNQVYQGAVFDYYFLDEDFDRQYQEDVKFGKTIGFLTSTVLLVSYMGLIGMLIFITHKRAKEISIRRILGSSDISIMYLFLRDSARQILFAALVAIPTSVYMLGAWVERYPYRVSFTAEIFYVPVLFVFSITLLAVGCVVYRIIGHKQVMGALKSE